MSESTSRRLGALLFPGFELLDTFGPLEMFGFLTGAIDVVTVAAQAGPVASAQGVHAVADHGFADAPRLDLLLIPGGIGTRAEVDNPVLLDFLRARVPTAELTMTVCTGTSLLARTGLLDGRRATSNKASFQWVADQGPRVEWVRAARWVEDGPFFTSSGVSAGMDMALAVIAKLAGQDIADAVATRAEYEWHRDASWDPFAKVHGLA
ncbi:MAG TPA: DJ-1/PfpI family protein [Candidatus Dormibacteraeota bacterium]|nr:DJ-1/PfpI family protein [Candidatus Dormibacteraeota bacterium]